MTFDEVSIWEKTYQIPSQHSSQQRTTQFEQKMRIGHREGPQLTDWLTMRVTGLFYDNKTCYIWVSMPCDCGWSFERRFLSVGEMNYTCTRQANRELRDFGFHLKPFYILLNLEILTLAKREDEPVSQRICSSRSICISNNQQHAMFDNRLHFHFWFLELSSWLLTKFRQTMIRE